MVEVPDAQDLRFGTNAAYTLAAWVNVTSLPGHWSGIVTKGRDASNWYGIWINDGNYWVFGHQPHNQIGSAVKAGVWIHVVMIYNNGNKRIYLDGVLDNEATASASGDNASVLWFGAAKGVTEYAPIRLDDVRIYNHAVTDAEIQKIMKGTADAPIAYDPDPEEGADDVPRDIALGWTAGEFAATHDVYFGTTLPTSTTPTGTTRWESWQAGTRRTPHSISKTLSNTAERTTGESMRSTRRPTTRYSRVRSGVLPSNRLPIRSQT